MKSQDVLDLLHNIFEHLTKNEKAIKINGVRIAIRHQTSYGFITHILGGTE